MNEDKIAPIDLALNELRKPKEGQEEGIKLERKVTLLNACGISIGCIIGSGIFVSPNGLYTTIGALCYVELGTMIPKSGGDYAYINEAFGPFASFIFLFVTLIIVVPTSAAIVASTFAQYLLKPFYFSCDPPHLAVQLLGACLIFIILFVNSYNVKWSTKIQDVAAITKVLALIIIFFIAIGYLILKSANNYKWENFNEGTAFKPSNIASGFLACVFTFNGWNYLNFITEELIDPYRNLPRAIYISLPMVTLIYTLVNAAYFAVLTKAQMISTQTVGVDFARQAIGPFAAYIIPIFVACSCVGTVNGVLFTFSRMFFVGARDNLLPEMIAMINLNHVTPVPSLLILGFLSIILLSIPDTSFLIACVGYSQTIIAMVAIMGLIKMRFTNSKAKRPVKVNIILPIIFIIISLFIIIFPLTKNPLDYIFVPIIIAIGIPLYFIFVIYKPSCIYYLWVRFTQTIQKLLFCVTDELKND